MGSLPFECHDCLLTLSLAAVLIIAELHVNRFSENLASDLEIHVVLNDDVLEQETIDSIAAQINDVDNVRETVFSDKDHELEMMIEQKGEPFTAYRGEENPLSHAFFVKVEDETLLEPTRQEIALDSWSSERLLWRIFCSRTG